MRKRLLGWLRPRRRVVASGDRAVAAGGNIGAVWSGDVASGPLPAGALTVFGTGDAEHTHGWTSAGLCGPGSGYQVNCFTQQPYGAQKGGEGSC